MKTLLWERVRMVRNIWLAPKSLLAVVAGIVVTTALAFAIEIPVRFLTLWIFAERYPDKSLLDSSVGWMLSQSLYTVPALVLGGYVAARLAPSHALAHAIALAVLQDLLIVLLIFDPPHPVPPWMWIITLGLTPAAIISGGYLHGRMQADRALPHHDLANDSISS